MSTLLQPRQQAPVPLTAFLIRSGAPHRAEFAPVFKTAPAIDEVCALSLAKGIISRQTPLVGAKPWPLLLLASRMPQEIHRAAARSGRADRQR
jgi:hypothetical protein